MKDYEYMISQFIDNELSASKQKELFLFLSESEEGRETLSNYMRIKKETKLFYTGIKPELNEPKIAAVNICTEDKKEKKYKTWFYFSSVASIIFAFLLFINQFQQNPILTKYQNLQNEMIKLQEDHSTLLSKQMELIKLNNQLYVETEKLKTTQATTKNKTVKKVKINKPIKKTFNRKASKKKKLQKRPVYKNRNNYLANIPTFTIKKDDFIGQQIIGN